MPFQAPLNSLDFGCPRFCPEQVLQSLFCDSEVDDCAFCLALAHLQPSIIQRGYSNCY